MEYLNSLIAVPLASFLMYIYLPKREYPDPAENNSVAPLYVMAAHAPAPAVPPAMSNLSSVDVFPPLNENM